MDKDVYKFQIVDEDSENFTLKLPTELARIALSKNKKFILIRILDFSAQS